MEGFLSGLSKTDDTQNKVRTTEKMVGRKPKQHIIDKFISLRLRASNNLIDAVTTTYLPH